MDKEYIEREPLQKLFNEVSTSLLCKKELVKDTEHMVRAFLMVTEMIQDAPAADVVSRCAYNQAAWERDQAIKQLREDYGVGLGEKKSADVAPVRHGKWIGKPISGFATVRCSVCRETFSENSGRWKFCPNCGAKMDLEG